MTLEINKVFWQNEWKNCSADECENAVEYQLTAKNPTTGEVVTYITCRNHLHDVMNDLTDLMLSAA
jgi:hypothetical protein